MDIYSFINSKDVAAHCKQMKKTWNTCEMMVIIGRSERTKKVKLKALQELIDKYPDMPSPGNWWDDDWKFDSVHEKIKKIMEYEQSTKKNFFWYTPYVDIPVPFKRGDILTRPGNDRIFVLDSLDSDKPERLAEILKKFGASNYRSEGWGYFAGDSGALYGDHLLDYDGYEYYRGKLTDNDRLLHYLSLYFKDKIGIAELLNIQCRIILEHQLRCNFRIDTHGCYIPVEHLAENQLTEEELEQVRKGRALMPWVDGKLTIQQVEFLMKEFGGDYESVQRELKGYGGWYLGRCAGIAHDENHYEKTGDSRFNPARRSIARQILESYGCAEDGWHDNHANPENTEDNYPNISMPDYSQLPTSD